jgi:hypothetical protein
MATSTSSGNTSVTGTVTSTTTVHTVVCAMASKSGTGNATIGTVPAGKKWRIVSMNLAVSDAGANENQNAEILLNSVNALGVVNITLVGGQNSNSVGVTFPYTDAPQLAATQTAVLSNTGANGMSVASIGYVEETA